MFWSLSWKNIMSFNSGFSQLDPQGLPFSSSSPDRSNSISSGLDFSLVCCNPLGPWIGPCSYSMLTFRRSFRPMISSFFSLRRHFFRVFFHQKRSCCFLMIFSAYFFCYNEIIKLLATKLHLAVPLLTEDHLCTSFIAFKCALHIPLGTFSSSVSDNFMSDSWERVHIN